MILSNLKSRISILQSSLFYLWIALLPTQLGYHYWPAEALVRGLRVDYLAVTVYASEVVLLALVAITIWTQRLGFKRSRHSGVLTECQDDRIPSGLPKWFGGKSGGILSRFLDWQSGNRSRMTWYSWGIGLIMWSLIQLIWVELPLTELVFIAKLALWLAGFWAIRQIKWSRRLVANIFSIQLLVLAGLSLAQLVNQSSLQGIWYWVGERAYTILTPGIATEGWGSHFWVRPYGTFSHPNVLAGYALVVGLWLWGQRYERGELRIEKGEHRKWKLEYSHRLSDLRSFLLSIFGIVSGITIVAISYSQAAWLATIGAVLGYGLIKEKVPIGWFTWAMISSLATPVVLILLPVVFSQVSSLDSPVSESLALRNDLFQAYWQIPFLDRLLGLGWHGFLAAIPQLPGYLVEPRHLQPIHHIVWYLVSSLGWFPILILLVSLLVFQSRLTRLVEPKRAIMWVGILALGSVDHYWVTQVQGQELLVFLLATGASRPFKA